MIPYVLLLIAVLIIIVYFAGKVRNNRFINSLKIGDKIGVLCYGEDSEIIFTAIIKHIEKNSKGKNDKFHIEYVDKVQDNFILKEDKFFFPEVFTKDLIYPAINK